MARRETVSKLLHKDKHENGVWTNAEIVSKPSLEKTSDTFNTPDLDDTINGSIVELTTSLLIDGLIVNARREHIKRIHCSRHGKTADHAGRKVKFHCLWIRKEGGESRGQSVFACVIGRELHRSTDRDPHGSSHGAPHEAERSSVVLDNV